MFHKKWRGLDSKELCAVGDRINAESFLAWRETYHAELIKKGLRRPAKDPNRLTGRQFFEAQKALGRAFGAAAAASAGVAENKASIIPAPTAAGSGPCPSDVSGKTESFG